MEKQLIEAYQNFVNAYELELEINTETYAKKTYFGKCSTPKKCRFCSKEYKNSNSHLIPKFLGSKYLFSHYECDACNAHFKTYDSDLASFIGPIRGILGITGSSKIPFYKKENLQIIQDEDMAVRIVSKEFVEKIEKGERTIQIDVTKDNYVPVNVYKALLKIGLSIIQEDEMENFIGAFHFLFNDNEYIRNLKNAMIIFRIFVPGPSKVEHPVVHLFKRREISHEVPEKILVLHVKNFKFQMILPFNSLDEHLKGKMLNVPMCPVVLTQDYINNVGKLQFEQIDLSSDKTVEKKTEGFGLRLTNFDLMEK